jgi:hypothetical protein
MKQIRKMFQERKIDNEMFPDVSQLENMDKNEVLKKYSILLSHIQFNQF